MMLQRATPTVTLWHTVVNALTNWATVSDIFDYDEKANFWSSAQTKVYQANDKTCFSFLKIKKVIYTCMLKLCFIPIQLRTSISKMTVITICTLAERLTVLSICWWNALLGTVAKITLWTFWIIPLKYVSQFTFNSKYIIIIIIIIIISSSSFQITNFSIPRLFKNYLLSHSPVSLFKEYPVQHSTPLSLKVYNESFKMSIVQMAYVYLNVGLFVIL